MLNALSLLIVHELFIGSKPWSCLIKVFLDKDGDEEITCFCLTLINKVCYVVNTMCASHFAISLFSPFPFPLSRVIKTSLDPLPFILSLF